MKYLYLFLVTILFAISQNWAIAGQIQNKNSQPTDNRQVTPYQITSNRQPKLTVKDTLENQIIENFPIVVLPVPKNIASISTPGLQVPFENYSRTSVRFTELDAKNAELVTSDGNIIKPQYHLERKPANKKPYCYLIRPNSSYFLLELRPVWHQNKLQLEGRDKFGNVWYFNDIKLGNYQLRLTANTANDERVCEDSFQRFSRRIETPGINEKIILVVNLQLTSPTEDEGSAVNADGILFKTIIPQTAWKIPQNQSDAKTPVKIGLEITNNTQTSWRFNLFWSIFPKLMTANGKNLDLSGGNDSYLLTESDMPLLMPGQKVVYFLEGYLAWKQNKLEFRLFDKFGSFWSVPDLKAGVYSLAFTYQQPEAYKTTTLFYGDRTETVFLDSFWTGYVATPFVDFSL